jgi:2-polyprenyl-3-methyl-5-hydroxy-6-metoxy-1,4-benzoquinol methylase
MKEATYWNHNIAYHKWIRSQTVGAETILDVGCGDGALAASLDDGSRYIVGIDPFADCIQKAQQNHSSDNIKFICESFESYQPQQCFDAIVFLASIHHMDMKKAISKAKSILSDGGVILIVGIAKPSSIFDIMIEVFRLLPCRIVSKLKHMHKSEDFGIPVSYEYPKMGTVRIIAKTLLPGSVIRYGLFYRYLLKWTNQ